MDFRVAFRVVVGVAVGVAFSWVIRVVFERLELHDVSFGFLNFV